MNRQIVKRLLLLVGSVGAWCCPGTDISATRPSRDLKVAEGGDLVDRATGKPVYLLSTSVTHFIWDDGAFSNVWTRSYCKRPDMPRWLYGLENAPASRTTFDHIGFNAMNFFSLATMFQTLGPAGGNFTTENELKRTHEFYELTKLPKGDRSNTWRIPSELNLRFHDALVTNLYNAGYQIYLDLHPSFPSFLQKYSDNLKSVLDPDRTFVAPGQKSRGFDLTFRIGDPEARAKLIDLYLAGARHYWNLGVRPLVYKLSNESSYRDESTANRDRFVMEMRKRYGNIAALNAAWHTDYRTFKDITWSGAPAARIELVKFQEKQVADVMKEIREALRKIDPQAQTLIQVGNGAWQAKWTNFNLYLLNQSTGFVSQGTGDFTLPDGVHVDDDQSFAEAETHLKTSEDFARNAFYRALADGKPLLNTESYLAGPIGHRYEEFKRLLWSGVAEGVSLQNLWQWAGYWPAETTMTIKYLIQHPQVTSPESWDGIKAAQAEIDEVADIFLPRSNRERAKVAALFSYPSLRMNEKSANGFTLGCETMRVLNIPFDAIFEEQLAQDRQDRYSVLLALGARHVAPASIDALERWVKDGGVLVADGDSLREDEYGAESRTSLLAGLQFTPGKEGVRMTGGGERFLDSARNGADDSWEREAVDDMCPILVSRKIGKGCVLVLAGKWKAYALASFLRGRLRNGRDGTRLSGVAEVFLAAADDKEKPYAAHVSVQKFNARPFAGYLVMNHADSPRVVRVVLPATASRTDLAAVQSVRRISLPVDHKSRPSFVLYLPPRSISPLVLGPRKAMEARFGKLPVSNATAERKIYETKQAEHLKAAYVRPGKPIDLRPFANRGFDNQQGWKTPSAWFEGAHTNLVAVPYHAQQWKHTGFEIIRFDYNDNRTCIALASKNLPGAPRKVDGIPLDGQFRGVSFLLGATHAVAGETAMKVRFHYENGEMVETPVRVGKEIFSWKVRDNRTMGREQLVWKDSNGHGFYHWEWMNPHPTERLMSMDLISGRGATVPIVVAATALPTVFTKRYAHSVRFTDLFGQLKSKSGKSLVEEGGSIRARRENVVFTTKDGKPIAVTPAELKNGVIRFRLENMPDQFGKRSPIHTYWWGISFRGEYAEKMLEPDWTLIIDANRPRLMGANNALDLQHEVELPLALFLSAKGKDLYKSINGFNGVFNSGGNSTNDLTLHDLRLEW